MVRVAKKTNKAVNGVREHQGRSKCSFEIRNIVMEKTLEQNLECRTAMQQSWGRAHWASAKVQKPLVLVEDEQ